MKLAALSWLSGLWTGSSDDGLVEEFWLPPRANSAFAVSRVSHDGKTVTKEFMAVEESDADVLLTVTLPAKTIEMHVISLDEKSVVFADPSKHPPDHLTYALQADGTLAITLSKPSQNFNVEFRLTRAAVTGTESQDLVYDLPLSLAIEQAWTAWTRNDVLERWLTTKAHVSPVLGGPYELFWDPAHPDQNSTLGCRVTGLVPTRLLAFTWKGPVMFADLMNVDPPPTWVSVTFEELAADRTVVHFRHSGWGSGDAWQKARQWQDAAWHTAFTALLKLPS